MQSEEPGFRRHGAAREANELPSGLHERLAPAAGASRLRIASPAPTEEELRPRAPANDAAPPVACFDYVPRDLHDAVERWLPRMRKIAAASARGHEVDDLLQEIWLELHRSWDTVISADSPLAMALRIAKRRCNKSVRSKSLRLFWPFLREEPSDTELATQGLLQHNPEQQAALSQDLTVLFRILDRLDQRQRDAFWWRRIQGLTGEETGKVMNITTRAAYALEEEARMKIETEWQRRATRQRRSNE